MSQPISAEELKAMRDHALRVGRDPYYAEDPDAKNVLRLADAYEQALKDKERAEAERDAFIRIDADTQERNRAAEARAEKAEAMVAELRKRVGGTGVGVSND